MDKDRTKLEMIVAPDILTRKKLTDKLKEISYYLIVGIVSIIMMFIVPLISGSLYGDVGLYFPSNTEGWIIYVVLKVALAVGNVSIFVLFKLQAKTNIKNDTRYIEANKLLNKAVGKEIVQLPRSPKQMNLKDYTQKGIVIFLSSIGLSVVITSLIISFDLITFISSIVTTIISVCCGWVTMLKNEIYWIDEYPLYADMIIRKLNIKQEEESVE